jgi:1,4-dihydroxy-2-naphthoate polyprenyltransferase
MKVKAILWLKAARLKFHLLAMLPVLAGALIAYSRTGWFSIFDLVISELIAVSALIAIIFSNDYADHDVDKDNHLFSILAGHARANVEGLLSKNAMFFASVLFSAITILLSLAFVVFRNGHPFVLALAVIGLVAGIEYSHWPLRIGHRMLGELLIIVMYSFFCILFGFAAQAGLVFNAKIIYFSIPVGLGIFLIILTAEISDYDHDIKSGKRTIPAILGKEKTLNIYFAGLIALYGLIIALYFFGLITKITLTWIFITLPVAVYAGAHAIHKTKTLWKDAINVCGVTIIIYMWMNIMFCLNLALGPR